MSAHARIRTSWFALLASASAFAFVGAGCVQQDEPHTNTGPVTNGSAPTPATENAPAHPTDPSKAADPAPTISVPGVTPAPAAAPSTAPAEPAPAKPQASAAPASPGGAAVTLEKVSYDTFRKRIAANPTRAKFTMVDTWATWCGPCKENFPHVVEMSKKYGDKGLAVASVSFDDPTESKKVEEAEAFLREKNATFPNFLIDEETTAAFEKFAISTIPAVFIFGPDGKEWKRFTLDDPNHQFTYEEVEQAVAALLDGKDVPKSE